MLRSKLWSVAFAALIIVTLVVTSAPAALAQEPTTTVIFDGKALTGTTSEMTDLILNGLRPAVATKVDPKDLTHGSRMSKVSTSTCFGVTERQANGMLLLRETVFATDMTNGRFDAVVPAEGNHGDWPPHGVLFTFNSTQPIDCDELTAEISWRVRYQPDSAGSLTFSFMLNPAHPEAYDTMASQGDLGLFVASSTPTTMTINLETFVSSGCPNCLAHTAAVTNTIGAGVYNPDTVTWFGNIDKDAPGLTGMYVLPVDRSNKGVHSVTISLEPDAFRSGNPVIYIWFGRFDMPNG